MDSNIRSKYTAVIGLEVHAQLLTASKVFSNDAVQFGDSPNKNVSVITLAHPGTLPKLNIKAFEYAIKMGLACNSTISRFNIFDRKNYFYPDLPKGYQLTQDRTPICKGGTVAIRNKTGEQTIIQLNRIHLEEDAGKSIHKENSADTLIDFNRAGTPLIEIVTEPVINSSHEAAAFLGEVRKLLRYLEICDGNMEEGSMRCDANVSVMLVDATALGKKVEVKNMNSMRNVQRAIDFEIERQISEIEKGNVIVSETRTFDAANGVTYSMRTKEELNDYRYFPDPDLSPVVVSDKWLDEIRVSMPNLPHHFFSKFVEQYKLPLYDAEVLTDSKPIAIYFDEICRQTTHYKAAANWVMGPIKSYLNEFNIDVSEFSVRPARIAELIDLIETGKLSFTLASQKVFIELVNSPTSTALQMAQKLNVIQESNQNSILPIIEDVINDFPQKVEEYKKGKKGIATMFMGEVMKRSQGKADPKITNQLIIDKLNSL